MWRAERSFRAGFGAMWGGGVETAAIILPVERVAIRKFYGALVAAELLEVGRQPYDARLLRCRGADFVYADGVLVGADGERRGEVFAAERPCLFRRAAQAQLEAARAPRAALRLALKPRGYADEALAVPSFTTALPRKSISCIIPGKPIRQANWISLTTMLSTRWKTLSQKSRMRKG